MTPHAEDPEIVFLTGTYCIWRPPQAEQCELDLGCGCGSFTARLAAKYPERTILAADVMVGRLRKVVRKLRREKITNITPLRTEARHLVGLALPDECLDRIHLLCPDPWPKGRHRGHRLLASDFTAQLHRVLKKDGIFHFSSDDRAYCDAVETVMNESKLFTPVELPADLRRLQSDFEMRWIELGRTVRHICFQKLPLPPKPAFGH